jgi:tetratricopeptide (TPR) repeat protein
MKTAQELSPENKFVPARLPWLIAAAAVVIYFLTLNSWVSIGSLWQVARVSGWTWQPDVAGPFYWLVTWPFHFLPVKSIPIALNLFSVICASLALALLARSVALLPHDRTEEQRLRERNPFAILSIPAAWVPPVMAVIACGLQLTFWESATAASSDMFDLLLFAYVIRCLLEFRVDGRDSWLLRASFVYGAAMTNNWGMIGFFPVFLAALIWAKGISFFNARFLGRMFALGTVGLCLYLLLPIVNVFSTTFQVSFWEALKLNLGLQKSALATVFQKYYLFSGERPWWVLALPSLLPVLAMSIRWPSYFGDPSKLGVTLATSIFHLLYGVLLVVCTWIALDPQLSPRYYDPRLGLLLLPFYYLGALGIGYFSGYFLLVFGTKPAGRFARPVSAFMQVINAGVVVGIWLLLLVAGVGLVTRNLVQVRQTNGSLWPKKASALQDFAELMTRELPAEGAVVLSDDALRLFLVQADLAQKGTLGKYVFLETHAMVEPGYHRFLKKLHPDKWPTNPPKTQRDVFLDWELQRLVLGLGKTNSLFYLHPSFGYYFEVFYPQPKGLIHEMVQFPTNIIYTPPLPEHVIKQNQDFWIGVYSTNVTSLLPYIEPAKIRQDPGSVEKLAQKAHLLKQPNRQAVILARLYSRSLDFWGVQLQRNNDLTNAAVHFRHALELNPDNVAARVNLECNENLQAGRKSSIEITKSITERFGQYRTWDDVMSFNGPFDESTFCYKQGEVLATGRNRNFRQGAEEFARARVLAPDDLRSRLQLAELLFYLDVPNQALDITAEIHSRADGAGLEPHERVKLFAIESASRLIQGDVKGAERVLESASQRSAGDEALLAKATEIYMNFNNFTNSLKTIEMQLRIRPDQPFVLLNQGCSYLKLKQYELAVPSLTKVMELETNLTELHYFALFNRAVAYFQAEQFDEAQRDYEALQKASPTAYQVHYGLGEIAYRKKDTNAAIRNFNLYLANVSTNFVNQKEIEGVKSRLQELRRTSR